jgi:hypothetical protein
MHPALNLPPAKLKLKTNQVWDRLRKKYVLLTPEEWVRQHFISYLIDHLGYPEGRMASEYTVDYNGMKKRCDVVAFDELLRPVVIVECKAVSIEISENTFYQIARYASTLKAKLLILTNGLNHYCAKIDVTENKLIYLETIPNYSEI